MYKINSKCQKKNNYDLPANFSESKIRLLKPLGIYVTQTPTKSLQSILCDEYNNRGRQAKDCLQNKLWQEIYFLKYLAFLSW